MSVIFLDSGCNLLAAWRPVQGCCHHEREHICEWTRNAYSFVPNHRSPRCRRARCRDHLRQCSGYCISRHSGRRLRQYLFRGDQRSRQHHLRHQRHHQSPTRHTAARDDEPSDHCARRGHSTSQQPVCGHRIGLRSELHSGCGQLVDNKNEATNSYEFVASSCGGRRGT